MYLNQTVVLSNEKKNVYVLNEYTSKFKLDVRIYYYMYKIETKNQTIESVYKCFDNLRRFIDIFDFT